MEQDTNASTLEGNIAGGPIGVFDSGFGGLTVLKEIHKVLPNENIIFVGDSARCPYGPRPQQEVHDFVLQICAYLVSRGCKLIVIACNTATAAGLKAAQRRFDVPIVGVVEPGARAAVHMTRNRRVGVIATQGTVDSGAYERAIESLDAGMDVISKATPLFVEMAEQGVQSGFDALPCPIDDKEVQASRESCNNIAEDYLASFRQDGIDTLVLGCTHFPLLKELIGHTVGPRIRLVSSAEETAADVHDILTRKGQLIGEGHGGPVMEFLTTGEDIDEFRQFGSRVMDMTLDDVRHVDLPDA